MKTVRVAVAVAVFASSFIINHSAFGQGTLTPPGPPGPTMLTLSQVEPRTPISAAPFDITQPGSYYLTTNLTGNASGGILIYTNNVTVDLNGFTISYGASGNSGAGIYINPLGVSLPHNITILNGFIQGGVTNNGTGVYSGIGFDWGIYCNGLGWNIRISGVSVSGVLDDGIFLGNGSSTLVENCEVRTAGTYGIVASNVKSCSALDIGGTAILGDEVAECRGESKLNGAGVFASATVRDCYGWSTNGNYGIESEGSAQNCYGYSYGSGIGVFASDNAINCYGYSTASGTGVSTGGGVENCQGDNQGNGAGINGSSVQNCYGDSTSGTGVQADNAMNSVGFCNGGGYGISASAAENCYGYNSGSGYGLDASDTALNCIGICSTGTGLYTFIATGCYGNTITATHNLNSY